MPRIKEYKHCSQGAPRGNLLLWYIVQAVGCHFYHNFLTNLFVSSIAVRGGESVEGLEGSWGMAFLWCESSVAIVLKRGNLWWSHMNCQEYYTTISHNMPLSDKIIIMINGIIFCHSGLTDNLLKKIINSWVSAN